MSGYNRNETQSCKYCGQALHGSYCAYSPTHQHEEIGDEDHCVYCGSTSYGSYCAYSLESNHLHKHGPSRSGSAKCKWCGSTTKNTYCPYSPNHEHEF